MNSSLGNQIFEIFMKNSLIVGLISKPLSNLCNNDTPKSLLHVCCNQYECWKEKLKNRQFLFKRKFWLNKQNRSCLVNERLSTGSSVNDVIRRKTKQQTKTFFWNPILPTIYGWPHAVWSRQKQKQQSIWL